MDKYDLDEGLGGRSKDSGQASRTKSFGIRLGSMTA